MKSLAN